MGFNYGYKLNDNPKLTSLGEISFEPVTEEHRARVDREIAIFFTNKAREHNAYGLNKSQTNYVKNQTSFKNDVRFLVPQKLIVRGYL